MQYGIKFRLCLNASQISQIRKTFGCCRFVWNHYLDKKQTLYKECGRSLSYVQCCKDMTALKKKLEWLKEADAAALQQSLRDLDRAYKNFFRGQSRFPRFKSKRNRQSYRTPENNGAVKVIDGAVVLPKLGPVRCRISREVTDRILSATISQEPSGKFFVSLCCKSEEIAAPATVSKDNAVGLDMGLKDFAVASDGTRYANHKYLRKCRKRLVRLQRRLSRKQKGSRNRDKARVRVARLHEHVANQRKDTMHKTALSIVRKYDVICVENLAVKNMMKNHKMAGSIGDASWRQFRTILEYKAERYGKRCIAVPRKFPSSQQCSVCGEKNPTVKDLKVRRWECGHCHTWHDRDLNAAVNILNEGLRLLA